MNDTDVADIIEMIRESAALLNSSSDLQAENLKLRALLKKAQIHVWRQQFAGRHEQDRIDAIALWTELEAEGITK